jgi:biopolymer transport protein ExbD
MKKHSLKTDMTPMVDLGFLLIAFFIMTTELNKPVVTRLNMPHDGPPMSLGMSNALTVLLDDNNTVYYYHGDWEEAVKNKAVIKTTLSVKDGVGKIIREKQQALDQLKAVKPDAEGRDGLMLLIKAMTKANYSTVIDVLDEVTINRVRKYALVKAEKEEINYIEGLAK